MWKLKQDIPKCYTLCVCVLENFYNLQSKLLIFVYEKKNPLLILYVIFIIDSLLASLKMHLNTLLILKVWTL